MKAAGAERWYFDVVGFFLSCRHSWVEKKSLFIFRGLGQIFQSDVSWFGLCFTFNCCDQCLNFIESQHFGYSDEYFSLQLRTFAKFELEFRGVFCLTHQAGFLFCSLSSCEVVLSDIALFLNSGIFYFFITAQLLNKRVRLHFMLKK